MPIKGSESNNASNSAEFFFTSKLESASTAVKSALESVFKKKNVPKALIYTGNFFSSPAQIASTLVGGLVGVAGMGAGAVKDLVKGETGHAAQYGKVAFKYTTHVSNVLLSIAAFPLTIPSLLLTGVGVGLAKMFNYFNYLDTQQKTGTGHFDDEKIEIEEKSQSSLSSKVLNFGAAVANLSKDIYLCANNIIGKAIVSIVSIDEFDSSQAKDTTTENASNIDNDKPPVVEPSDDELGPSQAKDTTTENKANIDNDKPPVVEPSDDELGSSEAKGTTTENESNIDNDKPPVVEPSGVNEALFTELHKQLEIVSDVVLRTSLKRDPNMDLAKYEQLTEAVDNVIKDLRENYPITGSGATQINKETSTEISDEISDEISRQLSSKIENFTDPELRETYTKLIDSIRSALKPSQGDPTQIIDNTL